MRDKLVPMGFAAVPTIITKIWDNLFDIMEGVDSDLDDMGRFSDFLVPSFVDKQCRIKKKDDKVIMEVKLPGAKKEDVSISLQDNVLTVKAKSKQEVQSTNDDDMDSEYYAFRAVRFYRQLTLPSNADKDNIKASLQDGILTIIVPLQKEEKPNSIDIEIQ